MSTIPWLQHCSSKRVVLEDEFSPNDKPHKSCSFTVIMFDAIAYDYMESPYFTKNFDKNKHIAIYVNKVCPCCASVKLDKEDQPIQYLKLIDNTPANRARYGYVMEETVTEEE